MRKQKPKVDIIDVARAAGVSPSTVSRSFNHPGLLRPQTRAKIERAVQRLGYIRNRAAQTIHGKRSGTVGLIVPTINHAIFSEVIQAFSEGVESEGFTLLLAAHHYDLNKEYRLLRKFLEHRVDGVALIGLDHVDEAFQLLDQQEVPALAIWNYTDDSQISCVGTRNDIAGEMAAQHLIDFDHRDIALIFPSTAGNDRARERLQGAKRALGQAGITVPEPWRQEVPYSISQAKEACIGLLARAPRPTALLCGNDIIAQGAVFAAKSLGIDVPGALSVIGIGDFKGSAEMEPGLTTIHIPAREIGQVAGVQIARAITERDPAVVRHECPLHCVQRATTATRRFR